MESNLPELIGSEKQVKWAADIRSRLISANSGNEANPLLAAALRVADSKFWIETRNLDFVRLTCVLARLEEGAPLYSALRAVNVGYCKF